MDYICHYGIKGMKWGVRKDKIYSMQTPKGERLELHRNRGNAFGKIVQRVSSRAKNEAEKTYDYDMRVNGKNVGVLQMYQKPNKEMNIVWGSTKRKYRGRGYMSTATKLGEKIAKELGNTKMTAELVGHSPDIHTIARKRGYVKVGEVKTQDILDTWGGLTLVEKKL